MKNTELQKNINSFIGVKSEVDEKSTIHTSKQALYNRIFKADNFVKYQPNGKESKFDLLVNYNIPLALTIKKLKRIGNQNAYDLANNVNHTVCLEDLTQEVLLKFVEFADCWDIDIYGTVTFLDDEFFKTVFQTIHNYLYKFQVKHYKHQYIEIDGDIVDCNKITSLADYVSIDNLTQNLDLVMFINRLQSLDNQWLQLRLSGLSNLAISKELKVTYEKIRACEKRVRKIWNEWHK